MQSKWNTRFLLMPATVLLLVMLILPLIVVFVFSFGERGPAGGYVPAFTLVQYSNLPARLTAFYNTLLMAPIGTLLCLLVAYPLAYYLAVKVDPKWRTFLLVMIIVPFWTSVLIRTYAWIFILGGQGIPKFLAFLGMGEVRMINTRFSVLIGIVYAYMPLMVLPIYVSLEKLDKRLLEAAADLGSSPINVFRKITLPLSIPGIATGSILVFIYLMGEFLIPALLGGGKVFFIGNALVDLFLQSRNWPYGSAVAMTLVFIMLITITLYMKLIMSHLKQGKNDPLM